ncbi:xanthine dehydrogenase/oxidase-like [Coccinella septempunctata]|uniref:xanthine dehydrogenase/oxidase-like n=1 Tax=Coccinella septempunctata TaxID=41139 RepID=UPI001D0912B0|nr:xanthine dehydrogenase/oxidase-like [Coccinella septempunctata]
MSWLWSSLTQGDNGVKSDKIKFTILGKEHIVKSEDIAPETTLNDYLRHTLNLKGTKRMCYEGGCGACVVAVTKPGEDNVMAVNSCLVSILTCHGWKIDTVEGIGNPLTKFHPVQQALANFNGTQCGFCSPGMVMNMYALLENGKPTMKDVENSFGGNICRCTGYRPIMSAFKSLCSDASPDLLGKYPDIEDLVCYKPKEKKNGEVDRTPVRICYKDTKWIKVYNIKDLLDNLIAIKDSPYMLVAGNSAKGVYKLPTPKIYIDVIDVKELTSYELTDDTLTLGGDMSLTKTMELFYKIANSNPKFAHLKTMADHIDLIANVPVRNVGSLAGNLMMKHYHHEFPSDVFLTLETFGAKLVIVDTSKTEVVKSLPDFLKLDMNKKVIKSVQIPSLSSEYKYETYKIMPRAQNAHALVNAGFLFKLDSNNKVESATIVIGNINPEFIHATKTEAFLTGKELFNNETLQGAFKTLEEELKPDFVLPEPEPEFRKQLSIALFFKAVLKIAPEGKLSPRNKTAGEKMVRPISSGVQDYETNESLYPLTKAIPKIEALAQTSGQAQYIEDIPDHPHQLFGKLILAKAAPNSKITDIDASDALAKEGIEHFFTKDDIPGDNNFLPPGFGAGIVEKIFADGVVDYYHQPLGVLVGSDRNAVDEAADLIKITYEAPKSSPLLYIRDILKVGATDRLMKERELKAKKTGSDVKHTLTGTFDIGGQYHFHMETQCCLVIPTEDGLDMFPSSQWMDLSQVSAARMLKIPHNKVNVSVRRCGGGFGAKISRNAQISCATALAAWLTRKPVRISLSLKENMEMVGKRFPLSVDYEVKCNNGGVIQHLDAKLYSDHGAGGNEQFNQSNIFDLLTANYGSDPFDVVYYRTRTDTPANTWTRAPGSTEGLAVIESIMDQMAYETNIDPLDVRLNNIPSGSKLIDYIADLKEWADIDKRKQEIAAFNKENRWKKRGISVVPMAYDFAPFGPINVTVSIYHVDGSVTISHGGIEIGQGINTKAAQVCAFKFNIPLEKINIHPSNTTSSPNCAATGGSMTSEAVCYGINEVCDELLERLKPFKKDDGSQTWEQLVQAAYTKFTYLSASSQYSPTAPFVKPYVIYGSCATEVLLDVLTGQHIITRVDLIEDTGTTLSPEIDIGQVEGAFVMGAGYFTTEKIVFDKDGRQLTNNTWFYKPPGPKDIPVDFRVKFPKNNPNPVGVLQSKAVGEPPLCLTVSVPLAIRHAVASARQDADKSKSKYFLFDGPTTVEQTFMNSLNDFKQYTL